MITVCFSIANYFKTMDRRKLVAVQAVPPVPFKLSALAEGKKTEFGLPIALADERPKSMKFGLSPRTELAKFIRLLGSK